MVNTPLPKEVTGSLGFAVGTNVAGGSRLSKHANLLVLSSPAIFAKILIKLRLFEFSENLPRIRVEFAQKSHFPANACFSRLRYCRL
jgi:hypothetical protein